MKGTKMPAVNLRKWFTYDGVVIKPGLRVFTNDWAWGSVDRKQFEDSRALTRPGGQFFDGWFHVLMDGDTRPTLYNGERMTTKAPAGAKSDPKA